MRYALISDIHANRPALAAVLDDMAAREGIVATYHLGDLVGYAPWPDEVVEMLVAAGIAGVAGNYDSTVATDYTHCGCRYEDARQEELSHISYEWTRTHTSDRTKAFLAGLPFRIDLRPLGGHVAGPTVTLVHGNHALNTVYVHGDRTDAFLEKMGQSLGAQVGDAICFGHTHIAWHRVVNGVHFVNTGSVGRPKDGDWRAGYVLLDVSLEGVHVEFVRVEYDLETAARGIIDSDLPDDFAEHLRSGGAEPESREAPAAGGGPPPAGKDRMGVEGPIG
ncbi:MAG: metallophosphoesterase family protein [Gemmatimonadaceae bacterium]